MLSPSSMASFFTTTWFSFIWMVEFWISTNVSAAPWRVSLSPTTTRFLLSMCSGYWRGRSTRTIYLSHLDRQCGTAKARRDKSSSFTYSSMTTKTAFIGADCLSRIRMGPFVRCLKPRYCSERMRYKVWRVIFRLGMHRYSEMVLAILLLALTKDNRWDWHNLQKVLETSQWSMINHQMILLHLILKKRWCFLKIMQLIKRNHKPANIHECLSIKAKSIDLKILQSMIKPN